MTPVPPDTATLESIARTTGGRFFTAPTARDLEAVYANLGTRARDAQGEAGGHGGVRRRRARAAARRAGHRAAAATGGCREDRRRRRPSARPTRPGPGPVPDAVLRSLDLAVMRRIQSLVPGDHLTPQVGAGTELALIRPYQPGDDVRYIDWNVTARMREPHVRVHVGERAMTAWLMLDVSPSMSFGTALRRKADVAEGVSLAIGHVATRRGNRLGVVAFGGARAARAAAAPGPARAARAAGRAARRAAPADGAGATSLGEATHADGGARPRARARRRRVRLPRAARLGGPACARCAPATACSPSRCATRASSSCRRSATSGWSTRRPAASSS